MDTAAPTAPHDDPAILGDAVPNDSADELTPPPYAATGPLERPEGAKAGRIYWPYARVFLVFHLLLPLALLPYCFSWTGVACVFVGNFLFGSMGINVGYHRLLTHGSFKCSKWLEHFLALLGCASLQDSPGRWVAIHRMHHKHSDTAEDPHSPLVRFFWGHMEWLIVENDDFENLSTYQQYARDVFGDRFYLKLHRGGSWLMVYAAVALAFPITGFWTGYLWTGTLAGATQLAVSLFVWGVVVRTVYVWHITWFVNSLSHMFGYRNYDTPEGSRNNWFVALLTNGEGWHNNHHADQRAAAHGHHKWWELDITYLSIKALEKVGLVWDVVPVRATQKQARRNAKRAAPAA